MRRTPDPSSRPVEPARFGLSALGLTAALLVPVAPRPRPTRRCPSPARRCRRRFGYGGAVSSVDPYATAAGLEVLRRGRQRRRRGGRHGRRPRRDRAVLRRHRRRRLLRLLRRPQPAGAHHRRPGDRSGGRSRAGRVHRSGDRRSRAPSPELVTSGLSVGVPGTPATWERALQRWGRQVAGARTCARPSGSPSAASWSTRRSRARPRTTRRGSPQITPTAELFLPGGDRAGRRLDVPQPGSGRHLPRDRSWRSRRDVLRARSPRDIVETVQPATQGCERRRCRCQPGSLQPWTTSRTTACSTSGRPGSATAVSTCTGWRPPPAAAPPSARRSTSSRTTTCAVADRRPGAALLPRRLGAGLRRPERLRGRSRRSSTCRPGTLLSQRFANSPGLPDPRTREPCPRPAAAG